MAVVARLQIERRAADDLQNFGGRGLLRKRLFEVARPRPDFLEEARVADGDDGLIGEGLQETNLPLGEDARLGVDDGHDALDPTLALKRHGDRGADRVAAHRRAKVWIAFRVGDQLDLSRPERAAGRRCAVDRQDPTVQAPDFGAHADNRLEDEVLAAANADRPPNRAQQLDGRRHEGVEHGLNIEGRPADDLQHLRRCCLLLQRLGEVAGLGSDFLEEPRVLEGDHRLIGEGLELRDLGFGERRDFGAPEHDRPQRLGFAHQRRSESGPPYYAGRFALRGSTGRARLK